MLLWVALLAVAGVGFLAVAVIGHVNRAVAEVNEHAAKWGALAETQRGHEGQIRYLHKLVNPMARSTDRPWPEHLQETPNDHL